VRYPNVRVSDEMIHMLDARRIYEANATVFQSAKAMLKKALEI
jgi:flagellar basal-body rod protein FlgC